MGIKDYGLSEKLGVGTALQKAGVYKVKTNSSVPSAILERQKQQKASAESYKNMGVNPNVAYGAPYSKLGEKASELKKMTEASGGGSVSNSKVMSNIGRGWDDADDAIGDVKSELKKNKNYISSLGKVRDQYITSLDNYKKKTDDAISGNKTLIERNQRTDLDTLAGKVRDDMTNTNNYLGLKAATGGSASRMANRAIARSAGKERASVLTGYGDQYSSQNQAATDANEDYGIKRQSAYDWEEQTRRTAQDDYDTMYKAAKRLADKASKWKQEDMDAESNERLSNFLQSLNAIVNNASTWRANIAAKMDEYGGNIDELDNAAVTVNTPAELDTPEFDTQIDISEDTQDDWYNPKAKPTKAIVYYDELGRPVYSDGTVGAAA